MPTPSYVEDVDVTNLENAVTTLVSTLNELRGVLEELKEELKKIKLGTGFVTGVDLNEEAE